MPFHEQMDQCQYGENILSHYMIKRWNYISILKECLKSR